MDAIGIVVITIITIILFWQWRTSQAVKKIVGKPIPDVAQKRVEHTGSVLFYFYHPMCGPCRGISDSMDRLLETYPDRVIKINVAEERKLTSVFNVSATPTTIVVKNYTATDVFIGPKPFHKIEAFLS